MTGTLNNRHTPLTVLLADVEYGMYMQVKNILHEQRLQSAIANRLLWCGEVNQISIALKSGIYDLAIVAYSAASLLAVEYVRSLGNHLPVVMIVDRKVNVPAARVRNSGVLALVDRGRIDRGTLQHYLLYAGINRHRKMHSGAVSGSPSVLPAAIQLSIA